MGLGNPPIEMLECQLCVSISSMIAVLIQLSPVFSKLLIIFGQSFPHGRYTGLAKESLLFSHMCKYVKLKNFFFGLSFLQNQLCHQKPNSSVHILLMSHLRSRGSSWNKQRRSSRRPRSPRQRWRSWKTRNPRPTRTPRHLRSITMFQCNCRKRPIQKRTKLLVSDASFSNLGMVLFSYGLLHLRKITTVIP